MDLRSSEAAPEVTAVIPTRNRWPHLRLALGSVLAQRDVTVEVVVVDEGSSDETPERLASLDDPRITVVRHDEPQGQAAARNRGIREGRGTWVAFLDDDDVWSPAKLRAQLDQAALADASYVYSAVNHLDAEWRITRTETAPPPSEMPERLRRTNAVPAGASNMAVRRDLLHEIGNFDVRLNEVADWDLWFRCARAGRGAAVAEALVGYYHHPGTFRAAPVASLMAELDWFQEKHAAAAGHGAVELDAVATTRWIGMSYVKAGKRRESVRTFARGAVADRSPGNAIGAVGALVGGRFGDRILRGITGIGPAKAGAGPPAWFAEVKAAAPLDGTVTG